MPDFPNVLLVDADQHARPASEVLAPELLAEISPILRRWYAERADSPVVVIASAGAPCGGDLLRRCWRSGEGHVATLTEAGTLLAVSAAELGLILDDPHAVVAGILARIAGPQDVRLVLALEGTRAKPMVLRVQRAVEAA